MDQYTHDLWHASTIVVQMASHNGSNRHFAHLGSLRWARFLEFMQLGLLRNPEGWQHHFCMALHIFLQLNGWNVAQELRCFVARPIQYMVGIVKVMTQPHILNHMNIVCDNYDLSLLKQDNDTIPTRIVSHGLRSGSKLQTHVYQIIGNLNLDFVP